MDLAQSGKNTPIITRELIDGKFLETVQTTTELDETAILNRKMQIQGRQAQIRQQIERLKVDYDNCTTALADCDTMIAQLPPITIIE